MDKAFYALDFIALMTFSLSSLSSDLKVPIVFVTCCYHTPSSIKERADCLLSYSISSVKDVIVFPSFQIFACLDGQRRTRMFYLWMRIKKGGNLWLGVEGANYKLCINWYGLFYVF